MVGAEGPWNVESATAWLRQYEWGQAFIRQLQDGWSPERTAQWVAMVSKMRIAMYRNVEGDGAPAMAAPCAEEQGDILGWPVLRAELDDDADVSHPD